MARGFILKESLTKDTLLKIAAVGFIVVAALSSPYFLHMVAKKYFKEKTIDAARKRSRKLRELQKRKLLDFKEMPDSSVKITLSHQGKNLVRQYKLEEMSIVKPKLWDKKWRIITYDIPISKNQASNSFRKKMRDLGLYQLQKSIWVSPYECLNEMEFLCVIFDINMDECVYYFKASEIPREREVKKFFNL